MGICKRLLLELFQVAAKVGGSFRSFCPIAIIRLRVIAPPKEDTDDSYDAQDNYHGYNRPEEIQGKEHQTNAYEKSHIFIMPQEVLNVN